MLFLAVLVAAYAILWPLTARTWTTRRRARFALAAGMVVAGVAHLFAPTPFVQHLPPWVPERILIVYASGLVEIGLGLGLAFGGQFVPLAGVALALYLVAVFPGNLYVAVAGVDVDGQPGGIYPWFRLLLQPVFVMLAIWTAGADRQSVRDSIADIILKHVTARDGVPRS